MKDQEKCCSVFHKSLSGDRLIAEEEIQLEGTSGEELDDNEMVQIEGGSFLMGTNNLDQIYSDQEGPIRVVNVNSFFMDKYAVTNQRFQQFVQDTGYQTEAEKYGWSFVFHTFLTKNIIERASEYASGASWWVAVENACWKYPEGPDSNLENRLNHPVVHISWNDAKAFTKWAGKELPTEAEWEYAARGGMVQKRYPWGDELYPNGEYQCNIWQGDFPVYNTEEDGYLGTAPVDEYKPNGYGLYNMSGNVWEWCENDFHLSFQKREKKILAKSSLNKAKAMRGGSYLCHESYCNRYRVAARTSNTEDSSTGNLGFRCIKRIGE